MERKSLLMLPMILVSIAIGLAAMPETNIVAVNHRGLGHEHLQPWRAKTSVITDAVRSCGARLSASLRGLWGHPLRGPAMLTAGLVLVITGPDTPGVAIAFLGADSASLDGLGKMLKGGGGAWATQRALAALRAGEEFNVSHLRTLDTLRKDEWKAFDQALIKEGQQRLRIVSELIGAGLVNNDVKNGLGTTMLEWERVTDMDDANLSMDAVAAGENGTFEFELDGLPLPILHKDFRLSVRRLSASRKNNTPLDTTSSQVAGRKIFELAENLCFNGHAKKFGGKQIYGLTTHPDRNTVAFGTNGNWVQAAKTGENILNDVLTMKKLAEADRFYGPFWLEVSGNAGYKLEEDFKANSDKTIRQRLMEVDGIAKIVIVDKLADNNVVLHQATSDVLDIVNGLDAQTIQWDVEGGMQINFKAIAILIPRVRADAAGRSGVVHMS